MCSWLGTCKNGWGNDLNVDSDPRPAECPWHDLLGSSGSSRPLWHNLCGQLADNTTVPKYVLAGQTFAGSSCCSTRMQSLHGYICSGGRPQFSFRLRCIAQRSYYSIPQQRGNTRDNGKT